jgi:hypothetical protein
MHVHVDQLVSTTATVLSALAEGPHDPAKLLAQLFNNSKQQLGDFNSYYMRMKPAHLARTN